MIEINNLNKKYKTFQVLNNVNLSISPSSIFGIIGKSGAGKSTLLKCLNLLEYPDNGSIIVNNDNIIKFNKKQLRSYRQKVGMIFQHFNLLESQTIFDNIALPLRLQKKLSESHIKQEVIRVLRLVELDVSPYLYPVVLSGGQKQRVGIARSIVINPDILLCDEATSALDTQTSDSILDVLLNINEQFGTTIITITHQLEVVRKICDFVAVFDNGSVIEDGKTVDILLNPKHIVSRNIVIREENKIYLDNMKKYICDNGFTQRYIVVLSFVGNSAYQPILHTISENISDIKFNILRGEIDRIKHTHFGQLLVEFIANKQQIQQLRELLKNLNIVIQEVDY